MLLCKKIMVYKEKKNMKGERISLLRLILSPIWRENSLFTKSLPFSLQFSLPKSLPPIKHTHLLFSFMFSLLPANYSTFLLNQTHP